MSRDAKFSRWQACFEQVSEPTFLLNRQRRFLVVNTAWEQLTGQITASVRGVCPLWPPRPEDPPAIALRSLCCPPPEVLAGQPEQVRRLGPGGATWWDIDFLPFHHKGRLRILGRIAVVAVETATGSPPTDATPFVPLAQRLRELHRLERLPQKTPASRRLAAQVRLAAQTPVPVLFCGPAGVGKQWLARTLHQLGPARERPFLALDCARLPAAALAEVLFADGGLARQANPGTLYLRQPERLPRDFQARLHDLIVQQRTGAPRLIAGCRDEAGLLEELRCGFSTLVLDMPPLRERLDDLSLLVSSLLERLREDGLNQIEGLTSAAWDVLRAYAWPGNVRELATVLTNAGRRAKPPHIDATDLPAPLRRTIEPTPARAERVLSLDALLEEAERRLILNALQRAGGHLTRAAESLSIWRQRLARRMEALGIANLSEGLEEPAE